MTESIISFFISLVYDHVNRVLDAKMAKKEREELVVSTVNRALLGCIFDWYARSRLADFEVMDSMLREYADMFVFVSSKFNACGMMDVDWVAIFLTYACEMRTLADEPKYSDFYAEYIYRTSVIINNLHEVYEFYNIKPFDQINIDKLVVWCEKRDILIIYD